MKKEKMMKSTQNNCEYNEAKDIWTITGRRRTEPAIQQYHSWKKTETFKILERYFLLFFQTRR